jgi:hypothetical protein
LFHGPTVLSRRLSLTNRDISRHLTWWKSSLYTGKRAGNPCSYQQFASRPASSFIHLRADFFSFVVFSPDAYRSHVDPAYWAWRTAIDSYPLENKQRTAKPNLHATHAPSYHGRNPTG